MDKTKKIIKFAGNVLSVVAVVFIISKLFKFELDYEKIMNTKSLIWFAIALIIQIFIILIACFPWMKFVEIFSGRKMKFVEVQKIFVKSNLFKYIPGNIFQYVARNELAVIAEATHVEVASATLIDTVSSLVIAFLLSLLLVGEEVIVFLKNNVDISMVIIVLIIVFLLCIIFLLVFTFQIERIKKMLSKSKQILKIDNLSSIISVLSFYVLNNALNCVVFLVILVGGLSYKISYSQLFVLLGAFLFSLIAGIITPGASGGIGIRESVMMIISANMFEQECIVLAMLILRIISIMSDVLAWLLCQGRKIFWDNNTNRSVG